MVANAEGEMFFFVCVGRKSKIRRKMSRSITDSNMGYHMRVLRHMEVLCCVKGVSDSQMICIHSIKACEVPRETLCRLSQNLGVDR